MIKKKIPLSKDAMAHILLERGCVKFSFTTPFVYASGLKGPLYCDNRLLLSCVPERTVIVETLLSIAKEKTFDVVAGVATGGLPYASFLAEKLSLPLIYIRSKSKGHGRDRLIEGKVCGGERILLIEDLVNQGHSLKRAIRAAQKGDLSVSACLCLVDYKMKEAALALGDSPLFSLTDFYSLLHVALEAHYISPEQERLLEHWHQNPKEWSSKTVTV